MIVKQGEYFISNRQYHSHPAISSTGFKYFLSDCPAKYQDYLKRNKGVSGIKKQKDEYAEGTALHIRILEPEKFNNEVVEQPEDIEKRSGARWESFLRDNYDKCVLRRGGIEKIEDMAKAWQYDGHSLAMSLIREDGPVEVSYFWIFDGIMTKVRPDKINHTRNLIIDLKSTKSASINSFRRDVRRYHYDLSAILYKRGYKAVTGNDYDFVWIAQEKEKPYRIAVYAPGEDMIELGEEKLKIAHENYSRCMETGLFPGYPNEITEL